MTTLLLIWMLSLTWVAAQSPPRLELDQGPIRGAIRRFESVEGEMSQFLGIPFAQPPVGELRFKPPQPSSNWGPSEYDATRYKSSCMQKKEHLRIFLDENIVELLEFSEDCLYLNVFVPGSSINEQASLPVIVWMHGGDLDHGSGQIVGSTTFNEVTGIVLQEHFIVVTFNYRLNVFGFLTTLGMEKIPDLTEHTQHASGNMGLYDQHMALTWVNKNIRAFGGDPMRITLAGDAAGAGIVSLHVLSPICAGTFSRASSSSGFYSSHMHLPNSTDPLVAKSWKEFAASVGCESKNTSQMFTCLQNANANDLVDRLPQKTPNVVVDGKFLPADPKNMWVSGQFNPVDYIVGLNSGDGDWWLSTDPRRKQKLQEGLTDVEQDELFGFLSSKLDYPPVNSEIGRTVHMLTKYLYFKDPMDSLATLQSALEFSRDAFLLAPMFEVAVRMSMAGANVYMYYFDHDSPTNKARNRGANVPLGAGFGTQVDYLLGDALFKDSEWTEEDELLSKSMMNAWATFARTGKPHILVDDRSIPWPAFTIYDWKYVEFHHSMAENNVKSGLLLNASATWNILMPQTTESLRMKKDWAKDITDNDWSDFLDKDIDKEMSGQNDKCNGTVTTDHKNGGEGQVPETGTTPTPTDVQARLTPTMTILFYVMFGIVCFLTLLMFIALATICKVSRRT